MKSLNMKTFLLTPREMGLVFFFLCFATLSTILDSHRVLLEQTRSEDASKLEIPAPQGDAVIIRKESPKKSAMCMIVVNEELYLDEFVDYHYALGFDKFFIYDNTDGFEMKQWGKLKGDHVEVFHYPGDAMQMPAYEDCMRLVQSKSKGVFEWIAWLDTDEFLVLKKHDHLVDFLEEYCPRGGLVVNWYIFKDNRWDVYSPQPVTRRFMYHMSGVHDHVKTLARVDDIVGAVKVVNNKTATPHNFLEFKNGVGYKDTKGTPYTHQWFNYNGPDDVAIINHYKTKSAKEYVQKRERGTSDPKDYWHVDKFLKNAQDQLKTFLTHGRDPATCANTSAWVFDDSAWQFLRTRVPGYALFDEIAVSPFPHQKRPITKPLTEQEDAKPETKPLLRKKGDEPKSPPSSQQ